MAKRVQAAQWQDELEIVDTPYRMSYRSREKISYEGIEVSYKGIDVTSQTVFDPPEGTPWPAGKLRIVVRCAFYGSVGTAATTEFALRRRVPVVPLFACLIASAAMSGGALALTGSLPRWGEVADTGSKIIAQGEMSDQELQELIDEQADNSRIAVSLAPSPSLDDDEMLAVNFFVTPDNNGFSERIEVEQDGRVVYASGIVEPGYLVKSGHAPSAHAGQAIATVYAVDSSGNDHGNPVSVEIEIVEGQ